MKSLIIKISLGKFSNNDRRPSMLEIQNIVFENFLKIEEISAQYRRIERAFGDEVKVDLLFQFEYFLESKNFDLSLIGAQINSLKAVLSYEIDCYLLSANENQQLIEFIDDSENGNLSNDQISGLYNLLLNIQNV